MKLTISMLLLVLTMNLVTHASSWQKKMKQDSCPGAMSQPEMTQCARKEYQKADTELNKAYSQLLAILDDDEKLQLKEVQNNWIKYRDSNCSFVADQFKGGTMRPMVYAFCLADLTSERTAHLINQMKERTDP